MKITVWLVTRERATYVTAAEILALALVLFTAPGSTLRLVVGLSLLAHLGYTALTALPMGLVPGRPSDAKKERRNQDLRTRVVAFLNEVRRVEEYAQHAKLAGQSERELEEGLRTARGRMMSAAAAVVTATGRQSPSRDGLPDDLPATNHGERRDDHGVRVLRTYGPTTREPQPGVRP